MDNIIIENIKRGKVERQYVVKQFSAVTEIFLSIKYKKI